MPRKLLIIEDELSNRFLLSQYAEKIDNSIIVEIAENGVAALNVLNTLKPDIIFLDIVMPDMDGFEFLDRLKKGNQRYLSKVWAITGAISSSRVKELRAITQDRVIFKPFTYDDIENILTKT